MTTQAVSGRRYFTKAWLMEQKSLIALLVLIAIVSTMSPNFFTVNNLFNILQQTSVNAIMAVGMTLVILTSGIDLSVGSLLALTGAIAASLVGIEVNTLVAVAAALAAGAAIGAVCRRDCGKRPCSGVHRDAGDDAAAARGDHGVYPAAARSIPDSPITPICLAGSVSVARWVSDPGLDHGYRLPGGVVQFQAVAAHAPGRLVSQP